MREPASTIVDLAAGPDEEAPDLLERVLRRAQADPLEGGAAGRIPPFARDERLQALERQGQVRAALGVRDGVDLVDDHGVDAA